jgi:tripartite-type tricarboxylate transporter receptor subunit TctC
MRAALALVLATILVAAGAKAADYPTKPIRVIIPYAAGSTGEAAFRLIANDMETRLGKPFVIEARPGAAGNVGAGFVAAAEPDGYTLLLGATNNFAINQYLYPTIGFDPTKAFEPISILVDLPFTIFASPQVPAKTLTEVITLAKQKPGSLNYASSGIGSPMHLGGVLLGQATGIDMVHVPYRSAAQSLTALLANDVQVYIGTVPGALELEQAGKLKIISSAGPIRSPSLPSIPTPVEAGLPNFKIGNWWALVAPRGTPQAVVDVLSREIKTSLANPALKEKLLQIGMVPVGSSPKELAEQISRESEVWRDVIKAANITLN